MGNQHLHVTDVGASGAFSVNTFERAVNGVRFPITDLPHVVHVRHGRPAVGVVTGKSMGRDGRSRIEVMEPARGPRGPFVRNVTVDGAAVYPNSTPLPAESQFLSALAQYHYNPNDYYWNMANQALAAWMDAVEQSPPSRTNLDRIPATP